MTALHQMGHDSRNLLDDGVLDRFRGAILSPMNYSEAECQADVSRLRKDSSFEFVFDPQLYFPETNRGVIREWSYFPSDVDSADRVSMEWWHRLNQTILETATRLGAAAVCSPAVVPRVYSDDYFSQVESVGTDLARSAGSAIRVLQTILVSMDALSERGRPETIASIISKTACRDVYLVLTSDREPRREFVDPESLTGAMKLISLLAGSGIAVTVAFCSTDMVLWKAAGASTCATGKFFNLRRFTKSRFDEPSGGGGQLPYWVEESLLGFLRDVDLIRVEREGLVSAASRNAPYAKEITDIVVGGTGQPWLALSWRHYLGWFADAEERIELGILDVRDLLRSAERNWASLEERDVLMIEPQNNGTWIRPWRIALAEFRK